MVFNHTSKTSALTKGTGIHWDILRCVICGLNYEAVGKSGFSPIREIDFTFGVEGDEAVTARPILYWLLKDHLLWKDDHIYVVKLAQALQDLSHGFRVGLLSHGTNSNHNLTLFLLRKSRNDGE